MYSLGGFSKFDKNSKPLETVTARKPISKEVEWCQFELHSWFQCKENCGQVRAGMYSNKRAPRVNAHASFDIILKPGDELSVPWILE